jgi:hypothetical protein
MQARLFESTETPAMAGQQRPIKQRSEYHVTENDLSRLCSSLKSGRCQTGSECALFFAGLRLCRWLAGAQIRPGRADRQHRHVASGAFGDPGWRNQVLRRRRIMDALQRQRRPRARGVRRLSLPSETVRLSRETVRFCCGPTTYTK